MKNKNIQAHRGICAIMVFLSHILNVNNLEIVSSLQKTPLHFFFDGEVAVNVFFVISGFFYYKLNQFTIYNYIALLKRKILRIYPSHIIIFSIAYVILSLYQKYGICCESGVSDWFQAFWKQPVSFFDFIKGCSVILPNDTNLINPPVWYLLAEVSMFFIMPILVPFLNKTGWFYSLLIIATSVFIKIPFVPWIGYYLLGALIKKYNNRLMHLIDFNKVTLIISVIIGIFLLNICNDIQLDNERVLKMTSCLGASIIVLILYNKRVEFFERAGFQFIGNLSYEFYLCHFIVLLSIRSYISDFYLYFVICLLISVLSSFVIKSIVDKVTVVNQQVCKR